MNVAAADIYEKRAEILKAMAHPARLRMVDAISRGRKSVHELAELVDLDISTVSRHLTVLRNADIVTREKEGRNVYYSLRFRCVMNFFICVEDVLSSSAGKERHRCSLAGR